MACFSLVAQWFYVMARVLQKQENQSRPGALPRPRRVQAGAIPQNGLWQPTDGSSTLLLRYWTTVSMVLTHMTKHGGAPDESVGH